MKKLTNKKVSIVVFILLIWGICIYTLIGKSLAATTTTNTTLGITAGTFSFTKDTTAGMDSYFGHAANAAASINIGSYVSSVQQISASSSGDHRFTVSDLLGSSFTVTMQSSALTNAAVASIPAANIWYTGTNRLGTGKALTASPTSAVDIGTAPVTFVSRANNSGLSMYAQEITLKVAVPAAQAPGSYTGVITFTY